MDIDSTFGKETVTECVEWKTRESDYPGKARAMEMMERMKQSSRERPRGTERESPD